MKAAGAAGAEAGAEVTEFIARQAVKIRRLEEMPEAPKAVLKAVGKAEDGFGHVEKQKHRDLTRPMQTT